jgi:hypothetical protein
MYLVTGPGARKNASRPPGMYRSADNLHAMLLLLGRQHCSLATVMECCHGESIDGDVTVRLSLNFITGCWGYTCEREDRLS